MAGKIAAIDTLESFMKDFKKRYAASGDELIRRHVELTIGSKRIQSSRPGLSRPP